MSFYENILGILPPDNGAEGAPSEEWKRLLPHIAALIPREPARDAAPGEDGSEGRIAPLSEAGSLSPLRSPAFPASFYENILGNGVPVPGLAEALRGERPPAAPQASWATAIPAGPAPDVAPVGDRSGSRLPAVPQTAGGAPDHDAILEDALRAAGVPPHRLDSGHLVAAANLMAKEGLAPEDAYDRVMLQAAHVSGLVDPDDWQHLHGFAVDGKPRPTPAPPDETPQPRDFKAWPTSQEPTNEGRETGPYDSGSFVPTAPAVNTLAAVGNFDRGAIGDLANHFPALHDSLRAADVPANRLGPAHLIRATSLMANEGLNPADAYGRVVLRSARGGGVVEPGDLHDFHGFAVGTDAPPASTPQDRPPKQNDWSPSEASENADQQISYFDSRRFAPAAPPSRDFATPEKLDDRATEPGATFDQPSAAIPRDDVRVAQNEPSKRYSVVIENEDARGGHTIRDHVGKMDDELLEVVQKDWKRFSSPTAEITNYRVAEGSFLSKEAANDFVNRTIEDNKATVDLVASSQQKWGTLVKRFGYPTGKEAFRRTGDSEPRVRTTYAVKVIILHDPRTERGYRVRTAFPVNEDTIK
jgi:Bacterial CdiA-CT RNAse A domain